MKKSETDTEVKDKENIDNSENDQISIDLSNEETNESVEENINNVEINIQDEMEQELANQTKEELVKRFLELYKEKEEIKSKFEKKESEANDFINKYKRSLADIENLRKRTIQEKQDSLKYANFNIIGDLLVILDDFQRAIDTAETDEKMDLQHFVEGINMIEKQFADLLFKKYGVIRFCEAGDEFDPSVHQGMMMEIGNYECETVTEVFRKGYMLHDRVIRPAEVKVGKPEE